MKNLITLSTLLIVALLFAGSSAFAQKNENASGSARRGRVITKAIIVVDSKGDAMVSKDGGKNWREIEPVAGHNDQSECRQEPKSVEQQPIATSATYAEAFELAPSKTSIAVSSPSHAA